MRHYVTDSPEAIARITALALMADGAIDPSELRLIERHDVARRLGFDHQLFNKVIHEFCEDMLASSLHQASGQLELAPDTIAHLLQDIRSPEIQKNLLRAILDIVNADHRLAGGEAVLVSQAMNSWGLDLCEVAEKSGSQNRRWTFQSRPAIGA